jgi:nitrate/nitrite-specific signal transduction histidine kinase
MPKGGWPDRENPKALRKSLDKAHDNLGQVVRENDRLRKALIMFSQRQTLWIKIVISALGVLAASVCSILGWLIPYAIRGMAK